jgi:hypothetical protein
MLVANQRYHWDLGGQTFRQWYNAQNILHSHSFLSIHRACHAAQGERKPSAFIRRFRDVKVTQRQTKVCSWNKKKEKLYLISFPGIQFKKKLRIFLQPPDGCDLTQSLCFCQVTCKWKLRETGSSRILATYELYYCFLRKFVCKRNSETFVDIYLTGCW